MAGSINKVILVGNVGKDPEIRTTNDGRELANFSVATSDSWKDKATGERRDKTEWHRVVVFNENIVNVVKNYVKRGSKLYIEGQLTTRKWTDQNGQDKYTTEIVIQNFNHNLTLLDSRNSNDNNDFAGQSSASNKSNMSEDNFMNNDLDDEIPF